MQGLSKEKSPFGEPRPCPVEAGAAAKRCEDVTHGAGPFAIRKRSSLPLAGPCC